MTKAKKNKVATATAPMVRGSIERLLCYALAIPEVAEAARGLLTPGLFRGDEAVCSALWAAIDELSAEYPAGIPFDAALEAVRAGAVGLSTDEQKRLLDLPEDCDPDVPADVPGLVYRAYHEDHPEPRDVPYAMKLLRRFLRERAVGASRRRSRGSDEAGTPPRPGAPVEEHARLLARIRGVGRPVRPLSASLGRIVGGIEADLGRSLLGLGTGLGALDRRILGLRGMTLLGAAANAGKSALVAQLGLGVLEAARENDAVVVLITLEMDVEAVVRRLLSHLSGLPYTTVTCGSPGLAGMPEGPYRDGADERAYGEGKARLEAVAPRLIILGRGDVPDGLSAASLRALLARAREDAGARRALLIVDYLQRLPVPEEVAARGELGAAKYQVEMLHEAIEPRGDGAACGRDAVLAISETRKRPNGADAQGPATDDLMSTARLGYVADCVLMLSPTTDADLAELHRAGEALGKDARRRWARRLRASYEAERISPMTLEVTKGRDGMFRGKIFLEFHYEKTTMIEATRRAVGPDDDASEGDGATPEAGHERRVLDALEAIAADRPAGASKNEISEAAGNMNKANAAAALRRLVARGLVEEVAAQGCKYPRFRPDRRRRRRAR